MKPPCLQCGACCKRGWLISVTFEEAKKIPAEYLYNKGTELFDGLPAIDNIYPRTKCAALSEKNKCAIYDDRPSVCRDFIVGSPECINSIREMYPKSQKGNRLAKRAVAYFNTNGW